MSHNESNLLALMATMGESDSERPVETLSERRTAIVSEPARGAFKGFSDDVAGTYAVVIADQWRVVIQDAKGYGDAVCEVEEFAPIDNVGSYIFMWQYKVVGPDGGMVSGAHPIMREALQAARIARQARKTV